MTSVVYYSQQYLLKRRNRPNRLILENKEYLAVTTTPEIKQKSVKTPITDIVTVCCFRCLLSMSIMYHTLMKSQVKLLGRFLQCLLLGALYTFNQTGQK